MCSPIVIYLYSSVEEPEFKALHSEDGFKVCLALAAHAKKQHKSNVKYLTAYVFDIATRKFAEVYTPKEKKKSSTQGEILESNCKTKHQLTYADIVAKLKESLELNDDFIEYRRATDALSKENPDRKHRLRREDLPSQLGYAVSSMHRLREELCQRTELIHAELLRVDALICNSIESYSDNLNRFIEARAYPHMRIMQIYSELSAFTNTIHRKLMKDVDVK